jgi:hypothetical protein
VKRRRFLQRQSALFLFIMTSVMLRGLDGSRPSE